MGTQSNESGAGEPRLDAPRFDALLLLSFGGPEQPDDVLPFLRNVTAGRNVPDERLAVVAEQYELFGGKSPINDQNRALLSALTAELAGRPSELPIYWGNRNWAPYLEDTVATMAADGIERALVFVTSAFGSFSGCRQYRQDLQRATDQAGPDAPLLQKLRLFYNHPGFIEPLAANLRRTLSDSADGHEPRVVFTAHSIPQSMASACSYEAQLTEAATLTMAAADLADQPFDLVYQSRSGPPVVPWLEPDVNDHLRSLSSEGIESVALVPIGFISDHMEVMFDLDTQAAATAAGVGLHLRRVPTVGTDPRFVSMIRELVEEQLFAAPKLYLGNDGPWPDDCPSDSHCVPAADQNGRPAGRPVPAA